MGESENHDARDRAHLTIDPFRESAAYRTPPRALTKKALREDYGAHAASLLDQLAKALEPRFVGSDPRLPVPGLKPGVIVEVATMVPAEKARVVATRIPTDLAFPTQDIVVLRTERNDNRTEMAVLFVPDDARQFLRDRISAYGRDPGDEPRPDLNRFEVVEAVRRAQASSLLSGNVDPEASERSWWELWVRNIDGVPGSVASAARNRNIDVHGDKLSFPETTVLFLHTTRDVVLDFATRIPGALTELRPATGTIEPFLERKPGRVVQHDWVADLANRIVPAPDDASVVCVLDTGVAAEHPLLEPSLRGKWAYDAAWGTDDHHPNGGHGTAVIGLALLGDLEAPMNDTAP